MNTEPNTSLVYIDHDGATRELSACRLYADKAGRYWLWSEQLQHNLAYRERGRDACLLSAIDSLLFTIQLRDKRIAALQRIADLADAFADAVRPEEEG